MTGRFLTPLRTQESDNELAGTSFLIDPLRYASEILNREIEVPAGFVTDFASVPRLLGVYDLEGGKCNKAAVVHDYLYSIGSSCGGVTREQADEVLREAIVASGYNSFTATVFYRAVRIGGASHWKQDNQPQSKTVSQAMIDFAESLRAGA